MAHAHRRKAPEATLHGQRLNVQLARKAAILQDSARNPMGFVGKSGGIIVVTPKFRRGFWFCSWDGESCKFPMVQNGNIADEYVNSIDL
jgi:hypothetical protein